MELKWKKFTFAISRVWGAGFCAVIYNGDSRSQSCSGIVQTLELMSCCWIRLPRKSAKKPVSQKSQAAKKIPSRLTRTSNPCSIYNHTGVRLLRRWGVCTQQCWRPPRRYLYERSPFQGKSVHLVGHICNASGSSNKTKSYLMNGGILKSKKQLPEGHNQRTYLKSATEYEMNCPMNVVSYAQIAFKKPYFSG